MCKIWALDTKSYLQFMVFTPLISEMVLLFIYNGIAKQSNHGMIITRQIYLWRTIPQQYYLVWIICPKYVLCDSGVMVSYSSQHCGMNEQQIIY